MSDEQNTWPTRKRIRINHDLYRESHRTIAVTISTLNRQNVFTNSSLTQEAIKALEQTASFHNLVVTIYCFMPDHVHLLLRLDDGSDLIRFVNGYKSWTTRMSWRYGFDGKIWQRSFYDHILRRDESIPRHMRYIAENPVRAGLVADWREYPFSGSFEFDLEEIDW